MKNATTEAIMVVLLLFVSIFVILTVSIIAVWLTEEVRVFGLVLLPTGIVTALLVLYFDWRTRMRLRVPSDSEEPRRAA